MTDKKWKRRNQYTSAAALKKKGEKHGYNVS